MILFFSLDIIIGCLGQAQGHDATPGSVAFFKRKRTLRNDKEES